MLTKKTVIAGKDFEMLPFGLQPIHLILIAVVALLIFGPSRLPEVGRSVGKMITEFRKGAREMTKTFEEEIKQPVGPTQENIAPPPTSQAMPIVPSSPNPTPFAQPENAASNFCIHCGKANPAGAVFCNSCGSKIAE
jgi:sec-independent protein translocase protein TatA